MPKKVHNKEYACERDGPIREILNGQAKHTDIQKLRNKLSRIKKRYHIDRKSLEHGDPPLTEDLLILWVRYYEVSKADRTQVGLKGNFLQCEIVKTEDQFIILGTKIDREIEFHPHRFDLKEFKYDHPDGGNNTIKAAEKQTVFATEAEAVRLLDDLEDKFPKTAIRSNPRKLKIIRWLEGKSQKIILKINYLRGGGFYIDLQPNLYERREENLTPTREQIQAVETYTHSLERFVRHSLPELFAP
ncbi:MAG: hypothetical protein AAF086_04170 [Planctomycetota bacterium]